MEDEPEERDLESKLAAVAAVLKQTYQVDTTLQKLFDNIPATILDHWSVRIGFFFFFFPSRSQMSFRLNKLRISSVFGSIGRREIGSSYVPLKRKLESSFC